MQNGLKDGSFAGKLRHECVSSISVSVSRLVLPLMYCGDENEGAAVVFTGLQPPSDAAAPYRSQLFKPSSHRHWNSPLVKEMKRT